VGGFKLNNTLNKFFTQEIPFNESLMQAGNNLFQFEFSKTGLYKNGKFPVSAVVKSISLQ